MTASEVQLVDTFHTALNAGNVDALLCLLDEEVEVGGPRGSGRGTPLVKEWVDRANIRLRPRRRFHRGDVVVVEEDAEWRLLDTEESTSRQIVASIFRIKDGRIAAVHRHPDLASALGAADLSEADEVS